jgi:transposase
MEEATKIHVGLDVHKDSITVAAAEAGRAAARVVGKLVHDVNKLVKLLDKVGPPSRLHLVYEAGPTGYGLLRALRARGYECDVIAPSQMPKRPAASRVKTDGRDSVALAECSRAGQLRSVWVPEPADEAMRDLTRAREDGINSRTKARQQLKSFLLRHDVRYAGKTSWSKMHYRWLAELNFGAGAAQTAFTEYLLAVQACDERVQRLSQALQDSIKGWRFEPVVAALQALRGIDIVNAVGLVAEIGDLSRFEHPRQLMGYLGLVPSEHSSGERVRRGSITKTADRGGLELPLRRAHQPARAAAPGRLERADTRYGLEGAAQADQALCHAQGPWRADQQGLCGCGPGADGLRLGHRHAGAATGGL